MSYSPVRHSLSPCEERSFDLHVLGTPPAFILSQDQTRHPSYRSTPASRQERHLHLSDPGQVVTLSLFADSSCSDIDRNCSCSLTVRFQLLFCFHFSIVKVLISPCHLAIASQMIRTVSSFTCGSSSSMPHLRHLVKGFIAQFFAGQ